jgi:hypothetical protein
MSRAAPTTINLLAFVSLSTVLHASVKYGLFRMTWSFCHMHSSCNALCRFFTNTMMWIAGGWWIESFWIAISDHLLSEYLALKSICQLFFSNIHSLPTRYWIEIITTKQYFDTQNSVRRYLHLLNIEQYSNTIHHQIKFVKYYACFI